MTYNVHVVTSGEEYLKIEKKDAIKFILFSASWCPPCQQVKRAIFAGDIHSDSINNIINQLKAKVQEFKKDLIIFYCDVDDKSAATQNLISNFQISGIPAAFLIDNSENLRQKIDYAILSDLNKLRDLILKIIKK